MRRIIASWIDYMICMFPYVTLANVRGLGIAGEDIRIIRLVVYIALLGYLFITDYWLGGLTLGKWILGIRPEWHWEEGKARLVNSLLHTFLKFLLFVIWPVTLILYFCLDRQMPYDKRLGIIDQTPPGISPGKTLIRVAISVVVWLGVVLSLSSVMLDHTSKAQYYIVSDQKIPSIYTVLGKQKLKHGSSANNPKRSHAMYKYAIQGDGDELVDRYTEYLIQNEGFVRNTKIEEDGYRFTVRMLEREEEYGRKTIIMLSVFGDQLEVYLSCTSK